MREFREIDEVAESKRRRKPLTAGERDELLKSLAMITEDERRDMLESCKSQVRDVVWKRNEPNPETLRDEESTEESTEQIEFEEILKSLIVEAQSIQPVIEENSTVLLTETTCDVPIVGTGITDPIVSRRTSELGATIDRQTDCRIVARLEGSHSRLIELLQNPMEIFEKLESYLNKENRDSRGLFSVRDAIISNLSRGESVIPFAVALGEISLMSQQPTELLKKIESYSLEIQKTIINPERILSGERLIAYALQLSEVENGISAGMEAVRIVTNAFLEDCNACWDEFISLGIRPAEVIHLAFAYAYSKAMEVDIREGGFFSFSSKDQIYSRADILLHTAVEILSKNNEYGAIIQDVEEYFLSSTRVAADNIKLEVPQDKKVHYSSMTHFFGRPSLKGGRHRKGLPGKYYRSSVKVSAFDSQGEVIYSEKRSSKVRRNLDLENIRRLIPYFSIIMEYNDTDDLWNPREYAPIVFLTPKYSEIIGMKFIDVRNDATQRKSFNTLLNQGIIKVDNEIITIDQDGFEKATSLFSQDCELEKLGVFSSILCPLGLWEDGDEFLLGSVEKTKNVDIFERFFKYLSNVSEVKQPTSTEIQSNIHNHDYAINTLASENHGDILVWMRKLRSRNYFIQDGRSRLDSTFEGRSKLDLKRRKIAQDDLERWNTLKGKVEPLTKEDRGIYSIICASHTGRLIPKMNWKSLYPYNCPAFDRQSNSRNPSETYKTFPQFCNAFSSLGIESGIAKHGSEWSMREYPEMFVYYYQTKDSKNVYHQVAMLSVLTENSESMDVFLATPDALTLAEAPIITSEFINYLEEISGAIRDGSKFRFPSTRVKNKDIVIDFVARGSRTRDTRPLWGVGDFGTSFTSFRYQLDKMIHSMKELQTFAKTLKNMPSADILMKIERAETDFRSSYDLLLAMPFWVKDNEHDGISRSVVRKQMKALAARIENFLGLSSRRLGMGVAEQVGIGINQVSKHNNEHAGRIPIPYQWDDKTRMGTFKHVSSSHRLYYEELISQKLLHEDANFLGPWRANDGAKWIPRIIAFPRGASFFDSQLASDERTLLLKIKNRNEPDCGIILDIMSKKNPQKSVGEEHLCIHDNSSLVLSSTYPREGFFVEYDTRLPDRNSVLSRAEIIALAMNHYIKAEDRFLDSSHVIEGIGNQRSKYISETKETWLDITSKILPRFSRQKLGNLLSSIESRSAGNTLPKPITDLLAKSIVTITSEPKAFDSVIRILEQS
jgi:hypothetical protein